MKSDSVVLVALGALALVAVVLLWVLVRLRARTRQQLASAHAETAQLRAQVEEIERRLTAPTRGAAGEPSDVEFTITDMGRSADAGPETIPQVDRALFVDLVLRETVVKTASLAHGVRRALAPEVRNRIRFEVRREVKRSRKQRKADLREARREWEARQRDELDDDSDGAGESAGENSGHRTGVNAA